MVCNNRINTLSETEHKYLNDAFKDIRESYMQPNEVAQLSPFMRDRQVNQRLMCKIK